MNYLGNRLRAGSLEPPAEAAARHTRLSHVVAFVISAVLSQLLFSCASARLRSRFRLAQTRPTQVCQAQPCSSTILDVPNTKSRVSRFTIVMGEYHQVLSFFRTLHSS